jgi:hypothetical protein
MSNILDKFMCVLSLLSQSDYAKILLCMYVPVKALVTDTYTK